MYLKTLKIKLFLFTILLAHGMYSQEFIIHLGKNFGSYNTSTNTNNDLFTSDNHILNDGNSYALGVLFNKNIDINKVAYELNLNYNEYNLTYAYNGTAVKYSWQMKYLGLENAIVFSLFRPNNVFFADVRANVKIGINVSHYINGYMDSNGINYNTSNQADFKKNIVQPIVGFNLAYPVSEFTNLVFGYNASISSIALDSGKSFNLYNNQFFIGFNTSFK